MKKQKGQDIIEYALMLAVVVGLGFGLYSYGSQSGMAGSISSVFNNAGNLLGEAAKEKLSVASSSDDIIKRLGEGRYQGLADLLHGNPTDGPIDIDSDSETGQQLAQKLNIQTQEGDGWFARVNTNGFFIVSYYSAADNKGVTFSQLKSNYANNPGSYDKDSTGHYRTQIKINEGYYYPNGDLKVYNKTTGHVEGDGKEMKSIYPGAK